MTRRPRLLAMIACCTLFAACSDEAPRALGAPRTEGSASPVTPAPPPPTPSVAEAAVDGFLVPTQATDAGRTLAPSDCTSASTGSAQDGLWVATLTTSSVDGITYDLGCFGENGFANETPTTRANTFAPDAVAYIGGTQISIAEWVVAGLDGQNHWFAINSGEITAIELFEE